MVGRFFCTAREGVMLKFLRKYNKYILVVGGSLLMVAFIAPQAIQRLGPNPLNQTAAHIGTKSVTRGDIDYASREREAIMAFSPLFAGLGLGLGRNDPPEHWLLLAEEAERGGFIAEVNDGVDWLPELAREIVTFQQALSTGDIVSARQWVDRGLFDERITEIERQLLAGQRGAMGRGQFTEVEFYRALTKARGVRRMILTYRDSPKFSSSRAVIVTKREQDRTAADVLWLSGSRLASLEDIQASDEEVMAHYERFRDDDGSDNDFGYGYTLPARVKLAWLEISRDDVAFGVEIDPITLKKEYLRNRAQYPGEFDAERLLIESKLQQIEVDRIVSEADRVVREQTAPVLSRLKKRGVHHVLPAGENPFPSWEEIASAVVEGVRETTGHTISMPVVQVRDSEWLDAQAIAAIEGIGSAAVRTGSRRVSLAGAVLSVLELNEGDALGFQVGVPMVRLPAETQAGVRYYYTVLDVRDVSSPDDPREIWERLVRDTRELKAYERLMSESDEILASAQAEGMAALAERYSPSKDQPGTDSAGGITERDEVYTQEEWDKAPLADLSKQSDVIVRWNPFAVQSSRASLQVESFAEAVMEASKDLDPMMTRDAIPAEKRWLAVSVPESKGLAIVKIGVWTPTTQELYWQNVASAVDYARVNEVLVQEGLEGEMPYTFDAIRKRLDYRVVGATDDEEDADEDESDTDSEES